MRYWRSILLAGALILLGREVYLRGDIDIPIECHSHSPFSVKMSLREAKLLDHFFHEIMIREPLAYTMVGEKPMSFTVYYPLGSCILSFLPRNIHTLRGWKVWKKYEHFFQNERMVFWEDANPWGGLNPFLVLADKKLCREITQEHAADFQHLPGDLFQKVGTVPFLLGTLQKNEFLAGILFGFGRTNAGLYWERHLHPELPRVPSVWGNQEALIRRRSAWKDITFQKLDMKDLMLPVFVGNPDSDESVLLKEKYLAARQKIQRFYKGKDFLAATLSLYKYGEEVMER